MGLRGLGLKGAVEADKELVAGFDVLGPDELHHLQIRPRSIWSSRSVLDGPRP